MTAQPDHDAAPSVVEGDTRRRQSVAGVVREFARPLGQGDRVSGRPHRNLGLDTLAGVVVPVHDRHEQGVGGPRSAKDSEPFKIGGAALLAAGPYRKPQGGQACGGGYRAGDSGDLFGVGPAQFHLVTLSQFDGRAALPPASARAEALPDAYSDFLGYVLDVAPQVRFRIRTGSDRAFGRLHECRRWPLADAHQEALGFGWRHVEQVAGEVLLDDPFEGAVPRRHVIERGFEFVDAPIGVAGAVRHSDLSCVLQLGEDAESGAVDTPSPMKPEAGA